MPDSKLICLHGDVVYFDSEVNPIAYRNADLAYRISEEGVLFSLCVDNECIDECFVCFSLVEDFVAQKRECGGVSCYGIKVKLRRHQNTDQTRRFLIVFPLDQKELYEKVVAALEYASENAAPKQPDRGPMSSRGFFARYYGVYPEDFMDAARETMVTQFDGNEYVKVAYFNGFLYRHEGDYSTWMEVPGYPIDDFCQNLIENRTKMVRNPEYALYFPNVAAFRAFYAKNREAIDESKWDNAVYANFDEDELDEDIDTPVLAMYFASLFDLTLVLFLAQSPKQVEAMKNLAAWLGAHHRYEQWAEERGLTPEEYLCGHYYVEDDGDDGEE